MTPKVYIYWPDHAARWAVPWLQAVTDGFERHGIHPIKSFYQVAHKEKHLDCDLAVFWSHRPKHIIKRQLERGNHYLVMERGYVGDRWEWTSLGFDALNGRADFVAKNMPGDRWNKYFSDYLKPWKFMGDYILLVGQVDGDESIKNIKMQPWLQNMANKISRVYKGAGIRFRPHPLTISQNRTNFDIAGTEKSLRSLAEDLASACLCVTYNSNTGVESVLSGIPTVTMDKGSMAYNVSTHLIEDIPIRPKRKQWAHDLAYKQWTIDEIESGVAWDHLKAKYR